MQSEHSDSNTADTVPLSQRIELIGVHPYNGTADMAESSMPADASAGYDFSIGKDYEDVPPGEAPVGADVFYQPPHDTPVDNHEERAFPTSAEAAAEAEAVKEEEDEMKESEAAPAPTRGGVPPVVFVKRQQAPIQPRASTEASAAANGAPLEGSHPQHHQDPNTRSTPTAADSIGPLRTSAAIRGRRRSSSMATADRGQRGEGAGSTSEAHTHASSAPIAVPDEVRAYVYSLIDHHASTVPIWEDKIRVAEVYRDKPTRTGGRPAPLRSGDKGFLQRIDRGLADHAAALQDAQDVLRQQKVIYQDTTPVFQPRSPAQRRLSDANEAWLEECAQMDQQLKGYAMQTQAAQLRVDRLLIGDAEEEAMRHGVLSGSAARRGRSASRRGSRSSSVYGAPPSPSQPRSRSRRGSSVQRADGQLTLVNVPGSPALVPGGTPSASRRASAAGPTSEAPASAHSSVRRANPHLAVSPGSTNGYQRRGSLGSQAHEGNPALPAALHPDTIIRGGADQGSPYDRRSPYGRMSPSRRASLSQPSPHTPQRLLTYENGDAAAANGNVSPSSSQRQLQPYHARSDYGAPQPELITYRSPRGGAEAVAPLPHLTETQRKQLLLTIEYYETNAASLRKADLKTARDCFVELYGPQRGMRQYCNWIDDLALQALRQNR